MTTAGCYVHIPFCVRKCAYCDFNSYSGYTDGGVARYVDALERDIRGTAFRPDGQGRLSHDRTMAVDTIFFGGGTPTAIPAVDEARLLKAVIETLPVSTDAEITTEANPGTMDTRHLAVLREAGFNRISFGVQSFDAGLLKTLDRIHSADEAKNAVKAARDAGFENVSIDLMFALPRQSKAQWRSTLDEAFALGTDHISLYSLIVEEGTGFYTLYRKGRLPLPDEDTAAEMFQMAIDASTDAGMRQYEISNFAKPGRECRHNIHYWRNEPYYGFGCGAVSYVGPLTLNNEGTGPIRCTRVKSPVKYAETVEAGGDVIVDCEEATVEDAMAETMMLGLRLTREGVDCARFAARFGVDPREKYADEVERFVERGLLEVDGVNLRLTPRGVFLANEVMMAFI